jgi:hypothetical protein
MSDVQSQSIQSAKLFSSRRNWDSPNPSPAGECAHPPFGSGGRGTLAGERGGGRFPIPTRGHTLWYSSYICVLCIQYFERPSQKMLILSCVNLPTAVERSESCGRRAVRVSLLKPNSWTYSCVEVSGVPWCRLMYGTEKTYAWPAGLYMVQTPLAKQCCGHVFLSGPDPPIRNPELGGPDLGDLLMKDPDSARIILWPAQNICSQIGSEPFNCIKYWIYLRNFLWIFDKM